MTELRDGACIEIEMNDTTSEDPSAAPPLIRGLTMLPLQALTQGFDFGPPEAPPEQMPQEASPASPWSAVPLPVVSAHVSGLQVRQGFRVGNLHLMIRYEDGSELTELPQLFRMPNAPHWLLGMANLHGTLIPVFDLAAYLGVEREVTNRRFLLVLGHGGDAAGVLIEGLPERLRWSPEDRMDTETAPSRLAEHLGAACLIGETLWFDLQYKSLLDALERDLGAPH
jgi:twitching motility protein PilI